MKFRTVPRSPGARAAVLAAALLLVPLASCAAEEATETAPAPVAQANPCADNPCAGKNPCNPCAGNPCAGANPCGDGNPCGANPCGAKNPCNPCGANPCGENPCGAKNPCGANPCGAKNPCGANPCGGNPCGSAGVDPSRFVQPEGTALAAGDPTALLARGEALWNDRSLGKSGLACSSCHIERYGQMKPSFAEDYPHRVGMPYRQAGVEAVNAAEMVNFCMLVPMASNPLAWDSQDLAALASYVEHIQPGYREASAANPCGANPCGAANPCNPCGANPCGGNPCAARNPCAAANPCNPHGD